MELSFIGKVAIVAASSQGLGKAIAEQLVQKGANVMICGRVLKKLQKVKEEIDFKVNGKLDYIQCDLTNPNDIKKLVDTTRQTFGSIDIIVNNSGGPKAGTFDQITDEDWEHSFQLNLMSYVRLIRAALPDLKQSGGRIVNIASASVKQPIPGLLLSNTFRTGIVGLAKTLAEELGPYNILINTVAPGKIATDRVAELDQYTAETKQKTKEEVEQASIDAIPLNRYGTPEEFAKVVAFLVSEENTYMTGSTFLIDGGMVKSI
ncbi:SDR family oxidoreductase [Halalkalibacter hemicellulosilyticus]|uniref:3-oxoacyl-[acyl-carrier protein] reductase n=1 Tax=Halalkalibacter hemicellulosilyticusJCM 9152 TaxID=1236971 RepID=W4QHS6_9BACI|nr:SDR family oxidoreductase [Halalkalibacter hemicellulosilyticus]GAE31675.1 3-oxoacyl-[acyl-carrier protein] reductase [Halalkalibacter hemicellulosilyticusJCM 9152]